MTSSFAEFQQRRKDRPLAPVWVAVSVGLGFVLFGLFLVFVDGAGFHEKLSQKEYVQVYEGEMPHTNDSRYRARLVYVSNHKFGVRTPGFDPACSVLAGTACLVLGACIATGRFFALHGQRRIMLAGGILWHAVGLTIGVLYVQRAPRPLLLSPLLGIGVYEWLGLIPLGYGIPREWPYQRLHSAVFGVLVGAIPGAIIGAVLGYLTDLVRLYVFRETTFNVLVAPGWIIGVLFGGLMGATAMFVYGWFHEPQSADHQATSNSTTSLSETQGR